MTETLEIRVYDPQDEDAVVRLWHECALIVPHNNPKRDIERKLRLRPDWFLVGLLGGEIVATCMVGYDGHRGWVNYLAVARGHRRRGLGSAMMGAAEKLLREAGCAKVNLQVRTSNRDVLAFYRRMGYTEDDVVSLGKRLERDEPFDLEDRADP
jgi:ribosomal protein S18 acetylase RimI-like enzyme